MSRVERSKETTEKAVKVKWIFLFRKKREEAKAICVVMSGSEMFAFCVNRPPPHHLSLFSALIVLRNVLFSALSWLFILLVMPKNYFIIFSSLSRVACFCFSVAARTETSGRDVYRRMYLLVSGISARDENLFPFRSAFKAARRDTLWRYFFILLAVISY